MTVVPAGTGKVGHDSNRARDRSAPTYQVTFAKPYAIGSHEVTWDEWQACVDAGACKAGDVEAAGGDEGWGRGTRPVINVDWNDAQTYAAWLRRKTGQKYRLPSNAEWEYAARAGAQTRFFFGDDPDFTQICKFENGLDSSSGRPWANKKCSDGSGMKTMPVGSFKPNAFGLYDVHGNVSEWVQDCWHVSYFRAPADGGEYKGGDCKHRTVRLGTWQTKPISMLAYRRDPGVPTDRDDGRGFRIARDIE